MRQACDNWQDQPEFDRTETLNTRNRAMRQLAVAVDDIHSFNNSIQFVLQTKTNWPSLSITRQAYTNCQPLSKLTKLMTTKNSKQITESFCKFLFIHNNVETTLFSQQHLCICICQLHLSTLRRASHKICLTHVVYVRLDPRQKKKCKKWSTISHH